jgi:geranylgeranyl pyrophosphate synthase
LALAGADRKFRAEVERFYGGEDTSRERIAEIIAGVAANGGFEQTKAAISEYIEKAKTSLATLGNGPARAEFVAIADALVAAT